MFQFPDKMLRVFRNDEHQQSFEENGFVILPFYNESEITELTSLYHTLHPKDEAGFFPSTFSKDKNYRNEADSKIRQIASRSIEQYCQDIKVVCGSFIVKSPGPESGMCVHQDMSLVDESKYTGINIWVPLVDLSIENGAIFVLPKSHRIMPTYRGSSIPEFFSPVMDDIIDYLHPVIVKAGQAVIFDQSIIHYSPPNFSDNIRIVTNIYFTHTSTEYRTYFWDKEKEENKVEVFAQADNFMTNFEQFGENIRARPTVGHSLGFVEYDFPQIDKTFLDEHFERTMARGMILKAVPKETKEMTVEVTYSFFDKVKSWFN
jgi:hypothetical protein